MKHFLSSYKQKYNAAKICWQTGIDCCSENAAMCMKQLCTCRWIWGPYKNGKRYKELLFQFCSSVTRIILEGVTEVGWWQKSFRDPWKINRDNHFQYRYWLKRLKVNLLSNNFTKWSNTQRVRRQFANQLFAAICCRIVWVCLAILWDWRL